MCREITVCHTTSFRAEGIAHYTEMSPYVSSNLREFALDLQGVDTITEYMCNPKQQPCYSINSTIEKQRDDLKQYSNVNNCLYIICCFKLLCYCGFPDRDCSSNLKLYHTSWDTFEVMCKGLLKSKLDITRCLSSREVVFFLRDEWCCQCITITLFFCSGHIASSVYLHAPQNTIELLTHLARVEREEPNPTNSI